MHRLQTSTIACWATALEIIPAIAGLSHEAGYHAGKTDQCLHWPPADVPKHAINVAIGGKADMALCTAYVRL